MAAGPEAFLDPFVHLGAALRQPVDADAVGDVLEDGLRKGIRLLEDHPHAAAERDHVGARGVDVPAFDDDLSLDPRPRDDVVHPVQGAQERALAAARRPDEGRHQVRRDLDGDVFERPLRAVEEVQALDVDRDGVIRGRRPGRACGAAAAGSWSGRRHASPTTLSAGRFPPISPM